MTSFKYTDAAFLGLDYEPVTVKAKALCEDVAEKIEASERRVYKRRNKKRQEFLKAVGRMVGDLIVCRRRWLYRSIDIRGFTGKVVSFRTFRAIFEALRGLALIEVAPGYYNHVEGHGSCTRLRATGALLDLARQHGVDSPEHFHRLLLTEPLMLHSASRRGTDWRKIHGKRMKFGPTEHTRRLEADVRELNEFVADHEITANCDAFHGFVRIFNQGRRARVQLAMGTVASTAGTTATNR